MNTQLSYEAEHWLAMVEPGVQKAELAKFCTAIDRTLIKEFIKQGYYSEKRDLSESALKKSKTDVSMETIFEKLEKEKAKKETLEPWKAVNNWLENARTIMQNFLDEYPIGYLDEMYIDECGIIHVDIGCTTGDNKDGRWVEQRKRLEKVGLILAERKFSSHCYFEASGNNVEKVVALFNRGPEHVDVNFNIRFGEIEAVKLEMQAEAIASFGVASTTSVDSENAYRLTISDQLTESEVQIVKNEVQSFWNAVGFLNDASLDKMLVCQNLEMSLSLLSQMLKVETTISNNIAKRYLAEREAAKEYHALVKSIGNTFNPRDMREVVVSLVRGIEHYIHKEVGLNVKDIKIYPSHYGCMWAQLKYSTPRRYRKSQQAPRPQDDVTQWDIHPETKHLLDTSKNRKQIVDFCKKHDINILNMYSAYNTVAQDFIIQTLDVNIMDLNKLLNT